jgi:HSP20 family protein
LQRWLPLVSCLLELDAGTAWVAEPPEPVLITLREREDTTMAEKTVQRAVEKPVAITPIESLMGRINKISQVITQRAYEIFEGNGRRLGHDLDDWFKAEMDLLHPIHVQIAEVGENLEVKAEVPGFNEKEIEVSIEPRRLTITGKRESEKKEETKGKTVYSELCSDEILRVVDLPATVDAEKATATLKNGVLHLTMPKASKAKTVEIKPKAA